MTGAPLPETASTVHVDASSGPYEVVVGDGVLGDLAATLRRALGDAGGAPGQAALVSQATIAGQPWFEALEVGFPSELYLVGEGEEAKSPGSVVDLCRSFARQGLSRHDVVVAVGGGVVTDLAGFAAASYLRGVRYANVATTLLGQVDAAVGGKTGVNLPEGKNLMGAFFQPSAVLCDTSTLETLSGRELASGRGEMAKYAFLGSGPPNASLLRLALPDQVAHCVAIKAAVVATDEREAGRRALLNYGHTLAHAIEAVQLSSGEGDHPEGGRPAQSARALGGVPLAHGEAVAVGLVFAAHLARRLGRIGDERVALHDEVVAGFGLSPQLPRDIEPEALVSYMRRDKKAHHDLTFVLDGADGPSVVHGVAESEVLATLAEMGTAP